MAGLIPGLVELKMHVLQQLKCPGCKQYMNVPVTQCAKGHSMCEQCRTTLKECPTCKTVISKSRNFIAEAIIEKITIDCPKCNVTHPLKETKHKFQCTGEIIKCLIPRCLWTNKRGLIKNHIKEDHTTLVFHDSFKIKMLHCQPPVCVLICNDHYFWVRRIGMNDRYFWIAQDIHSWEENQKFYIKFEVKGEDLHYKCSTLCMQNCEELENMEMWIGIHNRLLTEKAEDIYISIFDTPIIMD